MSELNHCNCSELFGFMYGAAITQSLRASGKSAGDDESTLALKPMGRVIPSPKQREPVVPQNGLWSNKNFFKQTFRMFFHTYATLCITCRSLDTGKTSEINTLLFADPPFYIYPTPETLRPILHSNLCKFTVYFIL